MTTFRDSISLPRPSAQAQALRASVPVFFGYVPLGMAFGILMVNAGVAWHAAVVMSLIVFAGSAQFLAVGMLGAGLGLIEIGVATLVLNLRHLFYGLSFLERFGPPGWKKAYLIFGLTDETYAILTTSRAEQNDLDYCLWLTAFNQSYWVLGSAIGAVIGTQFNVQIEGLAFALTCMFTVLAVEKAYAVRRVGPFLVGGFAALVAIVALPDRMLLPAIGIAVAILLFAARPKKGETQDV